MLQIHPLLQNRAHGRLIFAQQNSANSVLQRVREVVRSNPKHPQECLEAYTGREPSNSSNPNREVTRVPVSEASTSSTKTRLKLLFQEFMVSRCSMFVHDATPFDVSRGADASKHSCECLGLPLTPSLTLCNTDTVLFC